jgi:hypothetical protein
MHRQAVIKDVKNTHARSRLCSLLTKFEPTPATKDLTRRQPDASKAGCDMIDMFSLLLSHGLLLLMAWRLLWRGDLDDDKGPVDTRKQHNKWGTPDA